MGHKFSTSAPERSAETLEEKEDVDWEALKGELLRFMKRPSHDDGTLGPLFLRLAWHSSGTYDAKTRTGGSNGATMRFPLEANDKENAGLGFARVELEKIKAKYPKVSYSDLWIFASYVFLEASGGPYIPFCPGRKDAGEDKAIAPGRLPEAEHGVCPGMDALGRVNGWQSTARHVREVFYRQGFNDKDIVALLCGGHVYGRCHTESSGYNGPWVVEPWKFSNEYAADMVNDKWVVVDNKSVPEDLDDPESVRPTEGKCQYAGYAASESSEEDEDVKYEHPSDFPVGKYMVDTPYINIREGTEKYSVILGRANKQETFFIIEVRAEGTAIHGRISCGGWVEIRNSAGVQLFKRVGELKLPTPMKIRILDPEFDVYTVNQEGIITATELKHSCFDSKELDIKEMLIDGDNHYGRVGGTDGLCLLLVSPGQNAFYERISLGWNDKPRSINIPDVRTQMMLVSDMVLLWDEAFKKHLEVYAEDEEALRQDFGSAFKRLTENGFLEFPDPIHFEESEREKVVSARGFTT